MKFFFVFSFLIYSNFSFSQGGCIGGTVTTLSPTVNYGNNTTLTLNVPTGSFQWQYSSDNSNWQNVSGGSVININNTATSTTSSFSYTGALQTFEVPAGVTSITASGIGAAGGHGYSDYYGNGGRGGKLVADLNTTPSETLNIYIGGRGHNSAVGNILLMTFTPSDGKGGFNGGGSSPTNGSGGGGGATDIRQGGINLSNRIFVVGAGGGGGQQRRTSEAGGDGGAGGGDIGQNGYNGNGHGGYGGTQLEGGAIGGNDDATPGQFGIGGNGGRYQGISDNRTGGSGGAGFYGGGGGENGKGSSGGGGGGGSSYSSGTITTNIQGYSSATGDGSLVLSYTIPASVTSSYTTSLTSPTYFRAVVTDGACVAYSTSSFISVNPNLIISNPLATLSTCKNNASSPTNFGLTGYNLTSSVTITAPSDFEISTTSNGTYSSSLILTNTSTVSETLYVRLNSLATAGSKSGTITATSTGGPDVITTISGTVNSLPNIGISGTTTDIDLVSLTASGGSTYAWSDGSSTSSATNTFDASGLYSLTVTDANGCISSTNLNIKVQHWGLSSYGEKTLDSAIQINTNGQIGSLYPVSLDGKIREYKTSIPSITIGTQVWTNKNLDVTTYRNGDPIPQVTDPSAWAGLTTGAWSYYNSDPANGSIYGKLYNWYAVNDPRGLAPQGWHIPTDDEWTTLGTLLGGDAAAGGKMKTTGITRWTTPNTSATNESGFAGLPGGVRISDGTFVRVGIYGYWWSATESFYTSPWLRYLNYSSGDLVMSYDSKKNGLSVRLIKD